MRTITTLGLSLLAATAISTSATAHETPAFSFTSSQVPNDGHIVLYMPADGEHGAKFDQVDDATDGRLSEALEQQEFKGDFGNTVTFKALMPFKQVTIIGTGDKELQSRDLNDLGGYAAAKNKGDDVALIIEDLNTDITAPAAHMAMGYALRSYSFEKYQKDSKNEHEPSLVVLHTDSPLKAESKYSNDLTHIVEGISMTRDLGTEPGNKMWPQAFVERVKPTFRGVPNVKIQVLDAPAIRREGMGALMGVGKGSINDPRLMVIQYNGDPQGGAPLALVGKGITFDTGGTSLKSNSGMWLMKSDLSGAAAVAGTVLAAAKRREKINLVGVMPLAENMPAQDAIRPGDVLETMGGKTIEVISTDAEGRLILADGVQYAQEKFDPYMLIDIATLTGSASRALGDDYAAVISRDMETSLKMMDVGKRSGEDVWPLPLHDTHFDQIKSDIANIKGSGGSPGASVGAAVIGTFIDEDLPWVHLDIAGVDWMDSSRPTIPKGHAGWGVRFMDQLVRDEANK